MPRITLNTLKQLLDETNGDGEFDIKTSYHHHGPGYLDKWLSIIEGKNNCWQKREAKITAGRKKKIIFSNGLLKERPPTFVELELISALCEYYDVYLWPGSNENFDTCKPVIDSSEFWEKRNFVNSASKEQVEKILSQQSVASDDYIIIDNQVYNKLVENINTSREIYSDIDTVIPLKSLKENADRTDRKYKNFAIIRPTLEGIKDIATFPGLKEIRIHNLKSSDWESCLSILSYQNFGLESFGSTLPDAVQVPNTAFKKMQLAHATGAKNF